MQYTKKLDYYSRMADNYETMITFVSMKNFLHSFQTKIGGDTQVYGTSLVSAIQ